MSRISRVAVAVGGAIAAVAATVTVPQLVRRSRDDLLAARVRTALLAVHGSAGDLAIRSERGVLTLRGEVNDIDDIDRLEAVARSVPGVADVDNLLRLHLSGVAVPPRVLTA